MAKFCTKCGRKLEEGEPCPCEREEKKVEEESKEVIIKNSMQF